MKPKCINGIWYHDSAQEYLDQLRIERIVDIIVAAFALGCLISLLCIAFWIAIK